MFNIEGLSTDQIDRVVLRYEMFKKGVIPISLQPGNSVVKQFIFRTRSWLFFTLLAHTLQIQIRYSVDGRDHQDTVRFDLAIQASITATMAGAVIGGLTGGIARLLSSSRVEPVDMISGLVSLILAVILSAVAVVSFARKSGVQQIVSVEDFWGGLFVGFLIGFLGQEFAEGLILPNSADGGP